MALNNFLRSLVMAGLTTGLAAGPAMAFETSFNINFGDLTEGTVVGTQYSASAGVTISALNKHAQSNNKPSYAVVYDPTNPDGGNGQDPDLEDPFNSGGNPMGWEWTKSGANGFTSNYGASSSDPFSNVGTTKSLSADQLSELTNPGANGRNLLIVQNDDSYGDDNDCKAGTCLTPNDERDANNFLIFDFADAGGVTLKSLDIFDIDSGNQNERARIAFFLDGNTYASASLADSIFGGLTSIDNKADAFFTVEGDYIGTTDGHDSSRFFFGNDGIDNVRRMVVALSSSGAISGLEGSRTTVPEPGSLVLLGLGILGLAGLRRRQA